MSVIDDLLGKMDLAKVTKEVEAMRADVAERQAKLAQAEKLLKLLNGEPLRKTRQPRKPKPGAADPSSSPPPSNSTRPAADATSDLDRVVQCLRDDGDPMTVAAIAQASGMAYADVDAVVRKNRTRFKAAAGGTVVLVR